MSSSSSSSSSSFSSSSSALWGTAAAAFVSGALLTAGYYSSHVVRPSSSSSTTAISFPATQNKKKQDQDTGKEEEENEDGNIQYPIYDYVNDPKGSFLKVGDMLIDDVLRTLPRRYDLPPRETKWLETMLNYTVKGGKMNRGMMVVDAGVRIANLNFDDDRTNHNNTALCRWAVLGWAIEFLQAWLLIADDIMDSSVTRRGQPCWYRTLGDAWYIAINDAVTIESLVYRLIKKHFAYDSQICLQLLDLMMETTLQTELGQLSDTLCDVLDLPDLTPQRWEWIVTYKTSFYSFYLSVAFAMVVAKIQDPDAYDAAREILVIMGVYFQAQDDYLDCYGTPEQIGKIGTDIADKKCGWLFTKAYHQLADEEQKKFLDQHYGKCKVGSPEELKIKELYTSLGLPQLYAEYEQSSYEKIMALKDSPTGAILASAGVPWEVFETFLRKVYKRSM